MIPWHNGMGKSIGNKACHLLVKWLIYSYKLIQSEDNKWSQNSYEIPFNSNAGRVLFMTGFFHNFLPSLNDLSNKENEEKWLSSNRKKKFTKEKFLLILYWVRTFGKYTDPENRSNQSE